jgi:hypothetical protein
MKVFHCCSPVFGSMPASQLRTPLSPPEAPMTMLSLSASGAAVTVTGQLDSEGLRFDWRSEGEERLGGVAAAMAAGFLAELRGLIAVCRSDAVAVYTPSDFPDAELSQEELDRLFS